MGFVRKHLFTVIIGSAVLIPIAMFAWIFSDPDGARTFGITIEGQLELDGKPITPTYCHHGDDDGYFGVTLREKPSESSYQIRILKLPTGEVHVGTGAGTGEPTLLEDCSKLEVDLKADSYGSDTAADRIFKGSANLDCGPSLRGNITFSGCQGP